MTSNPQPSQSPGSNSQSSPAAAGAGATFTCRCEEGQLAIEDVEANENAIAIAIEKNPRLQRSGRHLPPHGYAYEEIKNLVWAKKHPVFSVALEEWDRKERLVSSRVDRREKRSADLINQIFNIVGFYSVFQGVVLTAVSQLVSSANACGSQCGKVWFPILLTVVAAVVTIVGVLEKFTNLKKLERSIFDEKRTQGEAVKRGEGVRTQGRDFRFRYYKVLEFAKARSFWKNKIGVIVSLVVFTGIFILSYFVILCDLWVIKGWEGGL